jgi:hypothetical protein
MTADRLRKAFAWLLAIAPVPMLFAAVLRLGVNTLIADEFVYVEFIKLVREGGNWRPWIWLQHNEHRVIPMKLLMVLLAGPTHWNQVAEMLVSAALTALMVLCYWRIYRRSGGTTDVRGVLAFAPITFLACSLAQYENQFYGMMVCHYFTAVAVVASLWLLARRGVISLAAASVIAVIGLLSIANGFLAFPAGLAVLYGTRAHWGRWLAWCGTGLAAILYYFHDYIKPPHTPVYDWSLRGMIKVAKLGFATLGAPLAAGSLPWGGVLGIVVMLVALYFLFQWIRSARDEQRSGSIAAALVIFGFLSSGMIALGRAFMVNPNDPLGSRYITYTTLLWIGTYLLLLGRDRQSVTGHAWSAAAWALLIPGLLASNFHGLRWAQSWHTERVLDQYVLQTYELQSPAVRPRLGPVDFVQPRAAYLREAGLSAFAEPQKVVMLLNAANAIPTADLAAGRTILQRLPCPVGTLYDVAVMTLPPNKQNPGEFFTIAVAADGREVARQKIDNASVTQWTWTRVNVDPPLPSCKGKALTVRMDSSFAPGSGAMALACEPYYVGDVRQGPTPFPGRVLGLTLNAYRYGLVK